MKSESYVHAAIQAAKEENPNDMQDLIGQALNDKITDAINLKKVSLAGEFFNPQDGEIAVEEQAAEDMAEQGYLGFKGAEAANKGKSLDPKHKSSGSHIDYHARNHPEYAKSRGGDTDIIRHGVAKKLGYKV